jgi:hypothetical protein
LYRRDEMFLLATIFALVTMVVVGVLALQDGIEPRPLGTDK